MTMVRRIEHNKTFAMVAQFEHVAIFLELAFDSGRRGVVARGEASSSALSRG